ncbi:Bcr/CflA family multidrug efflux MFS transporter [Psychromonas ossibalaenae]|uniref:Bcr/CflA family multidrug efflux MFS transporter n=1 Tax=Psychromonas ossibalaenae TaxID=444922 RepID=UPI0003780253|nr:Bcr/CflA family multidrug efflux MFS transporter [Psychromonas ossibalaenae]
MSSNASSKLSLLLIIILGAISALTPLAIDMYLPAMPSIARELGVSSGAIQITLTAYVSGFAAGQLVHGPLADSYGRKPVLLIGTACFAVASVISATTEGINALMWVRAAQGFAGAASAVVIQAIVRDMFEREDYARTMSMITLVMTIAPLVAPMIGGHMAVWFGWRSIFWLLALIAVVVIIASTLVIPETLAVEKRPSFSLQTTLRNYFELSTRPEAIGLIFTGAFSFSGMFAFLTAGSFVYIELYGVAIEYVGYLFGLNVLLMMVMTSFNGRLVKKMGSHWMLRFGLSIQLLAGILLVAAQVLDLGLWGVVIPVMMFVSTISIIGSNSMALLLSEYPHIAGTASSLAGTLRFGTGALMAACISLLPGSSAWPMVAMMALSAVLSMVIYLRFARNI